MLLESAHSGVVSPFQDNDHLHIMFMPSLSDRAPSAAGRTLRLALLMLAGLVGGSACAQPSSADTLTRIKERGYITLGHRESSVPFAYYAADGTVIGYSHELALKVVDAVRRELDEPLLVLRLVPVLPMDRITKVRDGEVDLECGSTTHNSLRARQVSFSNTIFIIGTRLLTARNSGINDFSDLGGRRVVTTADTTSERLLRRMKEEQLLDITILTAPDYDSSFRVLEAGDADAFMMDDALLYGGLAKAQEPERWIVTGAPRSFEAYACVMKHGDLAFKRLVDRSLAEIMTSGEAEQLYRKWFMSPLPDTGLNLNFPLSDAMKALFRAPNDKPFQ